MIKGVFKLIFTLVILNIFFEFCSDAALQVPAASLTFLRCEWHCWP